MCFEINGLKNFKLIILRFLLRTPTYLYYSNSSKIIFINKTSFIIYKFTWIHINVYNFYTYVLKCIFWGNDYVRVYGCRLVWLLLYVFMVAGWLVWLLICLIVLFYQKLKQKNIFLIKVFTTSQTFAILTCRNTNLKCIKDCELLWIKKTDGLGLWFEDQYEAPKTSRNNCRLPGRPW